MHEYPLLPLPLQGLFAIYYDLQLLVACQTRLICRHDLLVFIFAHNIVAQNQGSCSLQKAKSCGMVHW